MLISKKVIEEAAVTVDLTIAKLNRLAAESKSEDEKKGIEEAMAIIKAVAEAFAKKHGITVKR